MLHKITINNFRCFRSITITLKELTIMVGKNNAGKSTLIEALRIASLITNKVKNLQFQSPPDWIGDISENGVEPSITNLNISHQNIIYQYGEGISTIEVLFLNKTRIKIFIRSDLKIFAILFDENNNAILNRKMLTQTNIPIINILPQISPLLEEEKKVHVRTVKNNTLTRLSSRNFRNQLIYYNDSFDKFKELSEATWKGLKIEPIKSAFKDEPLNLLIRDGAFTAEIGWMGHGLQMWLQTMWFLSRCEKASTVILDEPDVYMHADLQRRLIKLIKGMFDQVIIATHSVEIMSEVSPENILPVDKNKNNLVYANNNMIVQKVIDGFGSVHNIDIVRMYSSKKILFVEGDRTDIQVLDKFYSLLFPNTSCPLSTIPNVFVEGWSGWQRVIGGSDVFKQNKSELKAYCFFDSDYYTKAVQSERIKEANKKNICLHIWAKKEIENYLINADVIHRLIEKNKEKGIVSKELIVEKLTDICESLFEETVDSIAEAIRQKDKSLAISTARRQAKDEIKIRNSDFLSIMGGKHIISNLSEWTNNTFGISINAQKLLNHFTKEDIDNEIIDVLTKIDNSEDFSV